MGSFREHKFTGKDVVLSSIVTVNSFMTIAVSMETRSLTLVSS